jgi:hypothetical protein
MLTTTEKDAHITLLTSKLELQDPVSNQLLIFAQTPMYQNMEYTEPSRAEYGKTILLHHLMNTT